MKVLVVDDHDELRRMTVQFLDLLGHTAAQASDADAARKALTDDPAIDLVLLDLNLGTTSGRKLADELQTARPALRVLFMSGYGAEDALAPEDPDALPVNRAFLEKPFTISSLESALNELMAGGPSP
jgi:DNA-binding NtrC family response regulator